MKILSQSQIEQLDADGLDRYAEFIRTPEYLRQLQAMPSEDLRRIISHAGQDAYATPEMARRMKEIERLDAEQSRDMDLLARLDKMIEWSEADVAAQRRGAPPDTRFSDAQVTSLAEQAYDRLGQRQENFRRRMEVIDRQYFGDEPPPSHIPSGDWYGQTAECLAAAAPECTPAQAQAAMQRFEQAFANHSHKEQILAPIRARLLGGQARSQQPG